MIALLISVASCTNDVEVDTISSAKQQQVTFEKISFNALFQQIKSEKVKANVQMVKENLAITAGRGIELDSLYFTKIVKENEYTTYLLELNSYTIDEPYFLKYVITQTDREEKAGYIKYIPEEEIPYIEPHNFTGTIQLLDDTFTVRSENYFIEGVEQENAARGLGDCFSRTTIVPHNCGLEGNHPPEEACNDGSMRSYFEIIVTIICPTLSSAYDNSPFPAQLIDIGEPNGGIVPTTPTPNNSFNPTAFKVYRTLSPTQKQWWDNVATTTEKNDITNYLEQNSHFSDLGILVFNEDAIAFVQQLIDFYNDEGDIKENIKQAISNGITTTAEYTHKIFKKFSYFAATYPTSITYINVVLQSISNAVATVVDTNPATCTFADLFNMWLFELGSNPIVFNGNTDSTVQLKNQEGVNQARNIALAQIQNVTFNNVSNQWQYGQGEFYDGMASGNFVTAFLGTYTTSVTITQTTNGYQLNFHVWNTSSWESATRFRIDNDHDNAHDGIFPNTNRDNYSDLSMGGNFTQHWYWSEPLN